MHLTKKELKSFPRRIFAKKDFENSQPTFNSNPAHLYLKCNDVVEWNTFIGFNCILDFIMVPFCPSTIPGTCK